MTRLEHFAAAAMSGVLANSNSEFGRDAEDVAFLAVKYAKALAEEIDRQFTPDCDDPDQKRDA